MYIYTYASSKIFIVITLLVNFNLQKNRDCNKVISSPHTNLLLHPHTNFLALTPFSGT